MDDVFVSIIIPGYNIEKYIREAIESVVKQRSVNCEIILIDDGSTDQTGTIMDEYSKKYSNVVVIHQKNCGQSSARNSGLEIARGAYILFLDGDDYLYKNAIEMLYKKIIETRADIILFEANSFFDENFDKNQTCFYTYKYDKKYEGLHSADELFFQLVTEGNFKSSVCLMLIRKKIVRENHIEFYNGIIHEDELFCTQIFLKANSILVLPKALYNRRYRANSTMTKKQSIRNFEGYFIVINESISILKEKIWNYYNEKALKGRIEAAFMHLSNVYIVLSKDEKIICKKKYQYLIKKMKTNKCCMTIASKVACYLNWVYVLAKCLKIKFKCF